MKIINLKNFPPTGYVALMFFGILFVRKNGDGSIRILPEESVNHELIHYAQARELLWVFFYIIYALEFVYRMFTHGFRWDESYYAISFEREAYEHSSDKNYLKSRKRFAQWKQ